MLTSPPMQHIRMDSRPACFDTLWLILLYSTLERTYVTKSPHFRNQCLAHSGLRPHLHHLLSRALRAELLWWEDAAFSAVVGAGEDAMKANAHAEQALACG